MTKKPPRVPRGLIASDLLNRRVRRPRWIIDQLCKPGLVLFAGAGKLGAFEVRPDETTSFEIGPPFQAKTSMEKSGRNALVRYYLEGRAGELYVPGAKKNGKEVPDPQFQIIAAGGQTVHSAQFEFA